MLKNFLEWIGLKEKLHNAEDISFGFNEGEIWWAALGENIGIEINGKNESFSRPVYVYKKLSKFGFLAIPLSTKSKTGSWYVNFVFQDKEIVANLSQVKVISTKRLYNKLGELEEKDVKRIKDGFLRLYS